MSPLERYCKELESELLFVKRYIKFLNVDKNYKKKLKKGFKVLENTLEKIKDAKNIDELNKVIKVKKIVSGREKK